MGDTGKTDKTGKSGKSGLIALAIVIAALAGVLVWWFSRKPPPPPDCSFTGWKRTVGVGLETQVQDLNAVKGKLGISDSMVRDYDTLMKDYALKYDAACQDVRAVPPRMTQGEYTCLRRNMDNVLTSIRSFNQGVEAAKSLSDVAAQKEVALRAFDQLQKASATNYRLGCASSMNVNPKTIAFVGDAIVNYVEVTNGGNNDFIFSVDGVPPAFRYRPPSGKLSPGGTAEIVIERSFAPVPPTQPIKFLIRTNLNDEQEVAITVDSENMKVWENLGVAVRIKNQPEPGYIKFEDVVDDALQVVNASVKDSRVSEADKYLLASTILLYMHNNSAANAALKIALGKDDSLREQPSTLLLSGILANRDRQPNKALTYFAKAKNVAPSNDDARSLSDLFSGTIELNQGKHASANYFFDEDDVRKQVHENPSLPSFSAQEFCAHSGCTTALNRTFSGSESLN